MKRLTLQHAIDLAVEKGGLCLSTEYQGVDAKLLWQCAEGHTWEASLSRIRNSSAWCPTCAVLCKRLTLQHAKDLAAEKGGFCLSKEYINNLTKMLWQCSAGHIFEARYSNIQQGSWCPTCGGKQKLTLQHAKDLAESRGGVCLSKEYINAQAKMLWQCAEGHTWGAAYTKVYSGQWCPTCASTTSRGENLCRLTLEQMLGTPFPKTRSLPWLVTPEGNHLELDGYAAKLRLGFEYNGIQHYDLGSSFYFYTDATSFEALQARDCLKRKLCAENGVLLFQVDYTWDLVDIPYVICNQLVSFGFLPKVKPEEVDVDSVYAWGGGYSKDQLLSDIKTFVDLFGVPPTQSTWHQYFHECAGSVACVATYQKYFGSWAAAINAAGYTHRQGGPEVKYTSKDQLLSDIKTFVDLFGVPPTQSTWNQYFHKCAGSVTCVTTYQRFFGSWADALFASGYTPRKSGSEVKYTADDLLNSLVAYAQQNGCLPTSNKWAEYAKKNNKPSVATYYRQFGSWADALSASGCTAFLSGGHVKYTADDLIKQIVAYSHENGRLPTSREWRACAKNNKKPSVKPYITRFGSWSSALSLAKAQLAQDELNQLNKEKNLNSP